MAAGHLWLRAASTCASAPAAVTVDTAAAAACVAQCLLDSASQLAATAQTLPLLQFFAAQHAALLLLCVCVLQVILQSGYVEDHLISNVKITLGLIA